MYCSHGRIPVPTPATLEIIKGVPVSKTDVEGELVTPTGAALAVTLSQEFSSFPSMIVDTIDMVWVQGIMVSKRFTGNYWTIHGDE